MHEPLPYNISSGNLHRCMINNLMKAGKKEEKNLHEAIYKTKTNKG